MSRFYVPPEKVNKNKIVIDGKEAHHILDVMRMQEGDKVVVFDGTGKEYAGFIEFADRKTKKIVVQVIRVGEPPLESFPEVTLAQALPKKGKMDLIVEKATELGVSAVLPVVTSRTIVRPDDTGCDKKVARWKNIAIGASKQCGRSDVPQIADVRKYKELVPEFDQYDLVLYACLNDTTIPIKEAFKGFKSGKILIVIGPEGDFTPEEIALVRTGNCKFVSLGRRVLKSDTAGLFALSVIGYEFS